MAGSADYCWCAERAITGIENRHKTWINAATAFGSLAMGRATHSTGGPKNWAKYMNQRTGLLVTFLVLIAASLALAAPTPTSTLEFSLVTIGLQLIAIICFLKSSR